MTQTERIIALSLSLLVKCFCGQRNSDPQNKPKQKDFFLLAIFFLFFYGEQYFNAELIKTSLTQKLKYKTAELNFLHPILKFERKIIASTEGTSS